MHGDLNQHVLRRRFGVFHEDIEVAVFIEHTRVEQLIFRLAAAAVAVRRNQIAVWVGRLRVLVEVLHVGVGWRRIEIEVVFLHILAVIPLAVVQPKQPFLENRIFAIPQRQRKAEPLAVIGDAAQAIFPPAVGARTGVVMREVIPGVAVVAVVLTDRSPLALAQVRPPLFPGRLLLPSLFKSDLFSVFHFAAPDLRRVPKSGWMMNMTAKMTKTRNGCQRQAPFGHEDRQHVHAQSPPALAGGRCSWWSATSSTRDGSRARTP